MTGLRPAARADLNHVATGQDSRSTKRVRELKIHKNVLRQVLSMYMLDTLPLQQKHILNTSTLRETPSV